MKKLRSFVAVALAVFAALWIFGRCTACHTEEAAGATYAAQQMACVDQYADRVSIDRCRERVRAAWDAGTEADQ